MLPKRGAVAKYMAVGVSRVPNVPGRLPNATPMVVPLLPVKARLGSWHEAQDCPVGSDKRVSKKSFSPKRSRGPRFLSSRLAESGGGGQLRCRSVYAFYHHGALY